jgi:hypothetical protein
MAAANQNFLITERRRHYLKYAGALSFFEINGPSVYKVCACGEAVWLGHRHGRSSGAACRARGGGCVRGVPCCALDPASQ